MNQEGLLIRVEEVVRRSSLSKATIYRLVMRGEFPAPVKVGRASLWRAADVATWAASLGGTAA